MKLNYLLILLLCVLVLFLLKKRFFDTTDYKALLAEVSIIVDIRSPAEFYEGNIENSLNIPVGKLINNLEYLKDKNQTIITCCASGIRSGAAKQLLVSKGCAHVINGGGWSSLNNKIK